MLFSLARTLCAAAWFGYLCVATAQAQPRFDFDATPGVLTKQVVPSRYRIQLDLDPSRDTFTGTAAITVKVRKPVDAIVLHAFELQASKVTLVSADRSRPLSVTPDAKTQTWRLSTQGGESIAAGDHTIEITYSGVVRTAGEGLFRADHVVAGVPARMLATQLEATNARAVFPCFDEPVFRAVFEISVRAPHGQQVASNMPLVGVSADAADASRQVHRFAPSPPMPSYLVSVAVGQFDMLKGEAAGIPLRILTASGKSEQAREAMRVTQQVLPYYTDYFGIPFALPKLDQFAVPSVRNGAMEDWGLISYSEPNVLFDPAKSSPDTQRWVYSVMAHEIAHQWFGNLVTAASWEEIWLNEAFATWMAAKATDHFNPQWQVGLRQRLSMDEAMVRDATTATRAIRSGPVSESRVNDVFDEITYQKGGAVLGMLEQWIGPDLFRQGLAAYMASQKYSNATAGDLWHHIGKAAKQDVAAVAASWTDQQGFPVIDVQSACEGGRTVVHLGQRRFSYTASTANAERAAGADALWKIPVRLARGDDVSTTLLDAREKTLELPGCATAPLVANAGGAGFYRVKYAAPAQAALANRFTQLAPADRVSLLSDTFALAQAGGLPMKAYFDLVARIGKINDASRATLFAVASNGFTFLDTAMAGTPAQGRLRAAGRQLFGRELDRLGWMPKPKEDAESTALRDDLIALLARFDHQAVIARANQLFDQDAAGQSPLPASIRAGVIGAVGRHADARRFDLLVQRLRSAEGEEDRRLFARALAAGRSEAQAGKLLALSIQGVSTPNIASRIPSWMARQSPFSDPAYRFTLQHWDQLAQLAGTMFGSKYWLLPGAAEGFNDAARAQALVKDQRDRAGADGESPAAQVAAQIELNAAVRQREAGPLAAALGAWRPAH